MPLFTHTLAVDWSAQNSPTRGKDSIWLAEGHNSPINFFTRRACLDYLKSRIKAALDSNERLIIGFDFAFGYPAGITEAVTGGEGWRSLWSYLAENVTDTVRNESNRFDVAGRMNRAAGLPAGPFWGHPHQHKGRYLNLDMKSPKDLPPSFPSKRITEQNAKSAQPVFKLTGVGAVGSQTILGIAALHSLITDPDIGPQIAVWPFETKLAGDFSKPITLAEIYPSSHKVDLGLHKIKDAAQVMSVARDLGTWNLSGALEDKLSAFGLSDQQRKLVIAEEGWILGQ